MIGDVPKGAPWRCRLGRHIGQGSGGLLAFTCPRCHGSFWQKNDHHAALLLADAAIDRGDFDRAEAIREEALRDA